jgi:hypothetical protein
LVWRLVFVVTRLCSVKAGQNFVQALELLASGIENRTVGKIIPAGWGKRIWKFSRIAAPIVAILPTIRY